MSKMEFQRPFSPTILENKCSKKDFIKIINNIGDEVLSDKNKSAQWDWSNHLLVKFTKKYKYQ